MTIDPGTNDGYIVNSIAPMCACVSWILGPGGQTNRRQTEPVGSETGNKPILRLGPCTIVPRRVCVCTSVNSCGGDPPIPMNLWMIGQFGCNPIMSPCFIIVSGLLFLTKSFEASTRVSPELSHLSLSLSRRAHNLRWPRNAADMDSHGARLLAEEVGGGASRLLTKVACA